jgi:hypothetical protein
MALPPKITVTGKYTDQLGNPLAGRVVFAASVILVNATQPDLAVVGAWPANLDATGSFSIALYATDAAGWDTTDGQATFKYRVTQQVRQTSSDPVPDVLIDLPSASPGGTATLASLIAAANA